MKAAEDNIRFKKVKGELEEIIQKLEEELENTKQKL